MGSNKVATVILMDIGGETKELTDNGISFFERSKALVIQILLRKMFSGETDEIGLILFGANNTKELTNRLLKESSSFENIVEFSKLGIPKWNLMEKVETLEPTDCESNWVQAFTVALDYLKEETLGKRFRSKQIVIFSTAKTCYDLIDIEPLINVVNLNSFQIVFIINQDDEYQTIIDFVSKIETGTCLKFEEAEQEFQGFLQKRKMKRLTNTILKIGSEIQIPLKWMKVTLEPTRLLWTKEIDKAGTAHANLHTVINEEENETVEIKYEMDVQKATKFGETEILLSYADLEAMKRQTGPSSFTLLGCVKRERISRSMIIGQDVYIVIPDSKLKKSQTMLSALVQAMIQEKKFGIARRIPMSNGKIHLGLLIPVSDESTKAFYFVKLPFSDYIKSVPYKPLAETKDSQLNNLIDNYIDKMTIDSKEKEFFIKDPVFQNRCELIYKFSKEAIDTESKPILSEYINKLYDPFPELKENVKPILNQLVDSYHIEDTDSILQKEKKLKEATKVSADIKKEIEDLQKMDIDFGEF